MVYLASPIDQMRATTWVDDLTEALISQPDLVVFRPDRAFALTSCHQTDPRLVEIDRVALDRCDVLLAILPRGVPTIGTPREIERHAATGKPWGVITDLTESFSLADALHTFPLTGEGLLNAASWAINVPTVGSPRPSGALLFAKDSQHNGQLPARAYDGDAGYDLYVAEDVTVPVGAFRDIPCGVRVALPPGVVARIVGRSSTLRDRRLIVAEGTIDNGWRGPLFAGVQNVGEKAVHVLRGERIAQLILAENVSVKYRARWATADQFAAIPHDGRGERGFGSSGT